MKIFNFIRDNDNLENFVKNNNIKDYDNILVQVFAGIVDEKQILGIIQKIKFSLPQSNIIGASTAGEIYSGTYTENEILVSFSVFEKTQINTLILDLDKDENINDLVAKKIQDDTKALILFSDTFTTRIDDLLENLHTTNPGLVIAGGKAGDNLQFKDTIVFNSEKIVHNGIVIAYLNSEFLHVNNMYDFGWIEVGKFMKITKAIDNVIYKIDGKTAIEAYKDNLGKEIANNIPELGIEFPIIITRGGMKIARTAVGRNEDGSLVMLGKVQEGDSIRFAIGHKENINRSMVKKCNNVLEKYPVEGIFAYSCGGRKYYLKEDVLNEIKILTEISDITGFFTQGEFYHNEDNNYILNYTLTALVLSEKDELQNRCIVQENFGVKDKVIYAFSKATLELQKELINLNTHLQEEVQKQIAEKEKTLQDSIDGYIKIIENIPMALCMYGSDRKVIYANKAGSELIGYSLEELIKMQLFDVWTPESRLKLIEYMENKIEGQDSPFIELDMLSKTGDIIPARTKGITLSNGITVGILQDIREIKKLEGEKMQLQELNMVKDNFINIASHELRTPLTSIKGYLSMMIDGDFGNFNEELKMAINTMFASSERLIQLVNDMLDISKLESGKMILNSEYFNVYELFNNIKYEYKNLLEQKKLKLEIFTEKSIFLNVDKNKFRQIIINLLGNAIKFTPENGMIKIVAQSLENGQKIKINIIDTGIGIEKEDISRIFEKFGQADNVFTRKQQGTGLGIPICKEIIKLMGGKLKLESQIGKGSNFYFTIPTNI
ncbi:MAG: ATP-binding protein [Candidatus Gracilibacteria bacterium]|nr:ATP-binding protein [Candidatus Gracilibacteria bacterium]